MESELFPVELDYLTFGSDGHLHFGELSGYPGLPMEVPGASGIHNNLFSVYIPLPVSDTLHEQKKEFPREEMRVVVKEMKKPIGESQEGAGETPVESESAVNPESAKGEGETVAEQREQIKLAMKRPMGASILELEKKKRRVKKPMFKIE